MNSQHEPGRLLHATHLGLSPWISRVRTQPDRGRFGSKSCSNPTLFEDQLGTQLGTAGDVAFWRVFAGHQAKLDRVLGGLDDDRNCIGRARRALRPWW